MINHCNNFFFNCSCLPYHFSHVSHSVAQKYLVVLDHRIVVEVSIITPFLDCLIKYVLKLSKSKLLGHLFAIDKHGQIADVRVNSSVH
jgi:hypothetical protein